MKFIIFLGLTLFCFQSFSFDSCGSVFEDLLKKNQETLSVNTITAMYHANYLRSKEGQEKIAKMSALLNTKIIPKLVQGKPFYEFSVQPQKEVKKEVLEKLKTSNPEVTIVYDLNYTY